MSHWALGLKEYRRAIVFGSQFIIVTQLICYRQGQNASSNIHGLIRSAKNRHKLMQVPSSASDLNLISDRASLIHRVENLDFSATWLTPILKIYLERIALVQSCPMDLRFFPFDNQVCPMIIESYTEHEELVDLQWRHHPIEYGKYAFFLLNPLYETKEWLWNHLNRARPVYPQFWIMRIDQ